MTAFDELYSEQALLGSLLLNNSAWDLIGDYLRLDDFATSLHRDIFQAISNLLANGKAVDIICIAEHLTGKHDDIFIKLCEIANTPSTSINIKHYAEIIKTKSTDRKLLVAAQNIINSVHEQKDNRLDEAQKYINQIAEAIPSDAVLVGDILKKVLDSIDERHSNSNEISGLATGFSDLDKITQGLHPGDLIILAGRPSMGKTLLGMNIAEHIALTNKPVAIFSLEMSKEQLLERSLASIAKIETGQLRSGKLTSLDFQKISSAIPQLLEAKLFINDRSSLNISDIRAACSRIKREHGLSLIVVDYLTLMAGTGENETLRISNISRGLKLLARDFNVPVIAISQLNRSVEQRHNKRPCMADLRQSGAIEQDADLILFIYRDEVYDENTPNKGIAEIIIAKHRNGSLGTVNLAFNSQYCRFDNFTGKYVNNSKPEKTYSDRSYMY